MNISLSDKRILVTGATGGIGCRVAEALRGSGAWVAGSYFKDEAKAAELRAQGSHLIQADLKDRTQVRSLVKQSLDEAGHLDALVYCAGNTRDRLLAKLSDQEWDEVIQLHLEGLVFSSQAVLPSMKEQGAGKIVALTSMAGLTGRVGQANYAAAKAGTIGFVKTLAREMGRFGITANAVSPGFIDSKMTRAAPPEAWERAKADSVLGKVSSVDTVASFLVWLLSDLAQGVTGQVFQLDSRVL